MRSRLVWAIAAGVSLAGAQGVWLSGIQPTTPFRSGVDLVSVDVIVNDSRRHLVGDLEREDCTLFEDNRPQAITLFQKQGVPLAVALRLDTSASMQESLATAQEAAGGIRGRLAS